MGPMARHDLQGDWPTQLLVLILAETGWLQMPATLNPHQPGHTDGRLRTRHQDAHYVD